MSIIDNETDWERLAQQWHALCAISPTAAAPLEWDWLRTWWTIYGQSYAHAGGLKIAVVKRGERLIGALPLYVRAAVGPLGPRRLGFLSTGEDEYEESCAEHLDLLHAAGEADTCLELLGQILLDAGNGWDELSLGPLSTGSPLLAWQRASSGWPKTEVADDDEGFLADLDGGFEAYLARLSSNGREQARRMLRAARSVGAVLELAASAADVDPWFDDLVRLHQERWSSIGQPGCFAAERFVAFHRVLTRQWVPQGKAVLARLTLAGQPLAAVYGFRTGPRFDFYQAGVRIEAHAPLRSPGTTAHLLLMRHLAERGVNCYDFLRGISPYKDRLSTDAYRLVRLRGWRPTARAVAARAREFVKCLGGAGRRWLRRRLGRARPPAHS